MNTYKEQVEYLENLLQSTIELWGAIVGLMVKGVVEKFGDEGKKVLEKASFEACKWQTKKFIEEEGIKERGTEALAKIAYPAEGSRLSDIGVFEIEHLELDDKKFSMKVTRCPYVKIWKALGITDSVPEICDVLTRGDEGISALFNPKLHMTLTKCMARGDPYCIYSWREDSESR